MKKSKMYKFLLTTCFVMLFATACKKDGPIENAGEKADKAIDNASDAVDNAADKIEKNTQ